MKLFSFWQILLSIAVVGSIGTSVFFFAPPERPADLESATGLTTAQLVDYTNDQCQEYEAILSSSAAGVEYENWVTSMSVIENQKVATSYRDANEVVYTFALNDFPAKLRARGAFDLQTLIVEDSRLSTWPLGEWNMHRLEEFYPRTFSNLAQEMSNLTVGECDLTDLSKGMQELTQQSKKIVALANPKTKKPAPTSNESLAGENARLTAQSYLRSSSFSRSGLISQLEYEGYSKADSTYGVDSLGADWNTQAAKTAAAYLKSSSFSREGLKDQLLYEGFSSSQAEYGLTAVGY